jgi:hypothetical protein
MGPDVRLLRWLLPAVFLVVLFPARASADTGTLFIDSQAGDVVGAGTPRTFTHSTTEPFSFSSSTNRVSAGQSNVSFTNSWGLELSVPTGGSLVPGTYITARRFTSFNGLNFTMAGRSCTTITGRFVVIEAVYGANGSVTSFAADFEQHCDDADAGLFGAIRFNSAIAPIPFGGSYPSYAMTVATPGHGNIFSTGALNCGSAGTDCQEVFGAAQTVALTATPESGYQFAGWTDDCSGGAAITLHVNGPKQCSARFELIASPDPRTLIVIDSQPGDFVGGGKAQVYSPANSRISIPTLGFTGTSLSFSVAAVDPTDTLSWTFNMGSANVEALHEGTYSGALSFASLRPSLQVRGVSSCTSSGRFIIRELVLGSGGTVARAAVDIEHHCSSNDAGLFASIRFNSTVDTVPFGGVYPVYRLTLAPPAHGTISGAIPGGTLTCGTSGSACLFEPASPVSVTLTATPDAGYLFGGWIGDCTGATTATVRVNTIRDCSAAFEPLTTTTPRSVAIIDWMPGARGTGSTALKEVFSPAATGWRVTSQQHGRTIEASITVLQPEGFTTTRRLSFSAPAGQVLQVPDAYAATWFPFASATPGMDVDFACSALTGRFVVRDIAIASDGSVARAAIDFEEHCDDRDPGIFGSLRYNSTVDALPFGGDYPRYRVAIAVSLPVHGRVTGPGLDCGTNTTVCQAEYTAVRQAILTATPDPGFGFAGWRGACHGGTTISLNVNGVKDCVADFEPLTAQTRTRLTLVSQLGESILQGRTEIYSLNNSSWSASRFVDGTRVQFQVAGLVDRQERNWTLTFATRTGVPLAPGTYTNADNSFSSGSTAPFMEVSGLGFCTVVGSTFTVRELLFDTNFNVVRAAIDFEQHCTSAGSPPLTGSILYQSAVDGATLALDKTALSFSSVITNGTITATTAAQTVRLSQTSGAGISWTAVPSAPWLQVTPSSGTGPATLTISVQPAAAPNGTSQGTITVTPVGSSPLPPVTVTMTVLAATTSPPFGRFETPIALTQNVSGAIALTGWALDDVEVTELQIWRQPHPSEPPAAIFQGPGPANGKVFIGNATFIDGARPDIEAAFALPNRSRAGWGYMMLTRGLVWDGQGLFTLHAIAVDREGNVREIGSTSLSVNNALATQPFGTIDTPGQGALASGVYGNTGWVISPNAGATIPAANVRVMIDGVFLPGVPSTAPRSDITAIFPQFDASEAGRGLVIDTRAYADGIHTIAWVVTDSQGHTDGIGSRFFRIANGGVGSLRAAERAASRAVPGVSADLVDAAPSAMSALQVRRGFDDKAPFETLQGSSDQFAVIGDELDRIEMRLPPADGVTYTGYLRALGELRPLPPGAALDRATGAFTWQPAAGFIGDYDFVFVAEGRSGVVSRHEVRVTLNPRIK